MPTAPEGNQTAGTSGPAKTSPAANSVATRESAAAKTTEANQRLPALSFHLVTMTSLRFKLILLFAVVAAGCLGCESPVVSGRVMSKRVYHTGSTTMIVPVGKTFVPIFMPGHDEYQLEVSGKNLQAERTAGWIAVSREEYDAAEVGDMWADGWHVAKAQK